MNLAALSVTLVRACLRDGGGGSPTAVLTEPGGRGLTDEERRRIPGLAGASHAVFVDEGRRGAAAVSLRFFTAEGELPACGHGTVAALAFLAERSGGTRYRAVLETGNGRGIAGQAERQGDLTAAEFEAGRVELRVPVASEVDLIGSALGLPGRPDAVAVATLGRPRMLIAVSGRSELDALAPDFPALRDACLRLGLLGCYVYAALPGGERRFAARMFAPAIGVPEDIANANSTACLAAVLHACEGISVDMGDSLGSPATVTAAADPGLPPLVRVGGTALVGPTLLLP
ncbi:trans-2,3-dihydro-3-hydroxyanthranilate isomerase [Streptacidiphilus sp. MAP12-20]|uniref:PhzF family phenazine biosynthesis protein n=1 Tax=Streptacidiphilus sp. MAP12-20 TaxID=3156299 RepID=UPI0035173229